MMLEPDGTRIDDGHDAMALGPGTCLRDILDRPWHEEYGTAELKDSSDRCVSFSALAKLTQTGRQDYSALLDAKVEELRPGMFGIDAVISGVDPKEIEQFNTAYENYVEAEEKMGPVMW